QIGAAFNHPLILGLGDDVGRFVLIGEVARYGLEDVDGGDQAFDCAELVDHDDKLATGRLERVDQIEHSDGFVHDDGRAQALLVDPAIDDKIGDQILGATDTHHFVE